MIDLHLHTTASDGRLSPGALVSRVAAAGITVMSVTDHDTIAGLAEVRAAADAATVRLIDGIEITAIHDGRDVHILGYFINPSDPTFGNFLRVQRSRRVERLREIGGRLARMGVVVDVDSLLTIAAQMPGASVGRPLIGRALITAGHVASMQEAFDRFLAAGQPAFVPRVGKRPSEVVDVIHAAGGIASMAHPGVTRQPAVMASLVGAGLDAIEVYHSDHSPETQHELRTFAEQHRLLVTGGSDYHGDDSRDRPLGRSVLPGADLSRLDDRATRQR
ncbi:MAG: PHP domain-containing protein [Verrucomicrobiaceae bacterium]|nr:PHP domain-containing protein [Verrucomicrobiaceae bacterium]